MEVKNIVDKKIIVYVDFEIDNYGVYRENFDYDVKFLYR